MVCTVTKMTWEYGEKYGHVYVPHDLEDFARNLHYLHVYALHTNYPFYLHIYFTNSTFIGIILGLDASVFDFGELVFDTATGEHDLRSITCAWTATEDIEWREFYYGGSLSNLPPQQFVPLNTVLHALMYYAEHLILLPSVPIQDAEFIEKYGQRSDVRQNNEDSEVSPHTEQPHNRLPANT